MVFLSYGVVRSWRWAFWLILIAFMAGILRVAAGALELTGVIGVFMIAGYRKRGIWGAP